MTRPLPLAIMALLFLWLAINLSTIWMWALTIVSLAALVGLIIAMRYRDMYVGPRTLVDDANHIRRRLLRDDGGEADRLEVIREMDEIEEERIALLEDEDEYETYADDERPRKRTDERNQQDKI